MREHFLTLIESGVNLITRYPGHIPGTIRHLYDGVILLSSLECFVKILSHSGIKIQLEILVSQIEATNSIVVLVVK